MSDDGHVCCLLCVCCTCGSDRQREALTNELVKAVQYLEPAMARQCADWIIDHLDLAPKDSLTLFKSEIARMAKGSGK